MSQILAFMLGCWCLTVSGMAQTTAFTYQGRLTDGPTAANGSYDLTFALHGAETGPAQVGSARTNFATTVGNGLFTVTLDFGNQFMDGDRWLEIGVRTNGAGPFTTLIPRQLLAATPRAISANTAANVTGPVSAGQLTGTVLVTALPPVVVTNGAVDVTFAGTFSGNGAGLADVFLPSVDSVGAIGFATNFPGLFKVASTLPVGIAPRGVATADVNGDGLMDLVSANYSSRDLTVLTNDGKGGFVLSSSPGLEVQPSRVVAVDVNGDGWVDLISGGFNRLNILTNDGKGGFRLALPSLVGLSGDVATPADVNRDGSVDLVFCNGTRVDVLTNDSRGGFSLASPAGLQLTGVAVAAAADLNGDGWVDLVCPASGTAFLTVFTNDGRGGFVVSSSPRVGAGTVSIVAPDVNGDGKPDLVSANRTLQTLSILTNNGSGGFVLSSTPSLAAGPNSVVVGDFNGDGKVDLVCPVSAGNSLLVLTNDGTGGFALAGSPGGGLAPFSVTVADLNGDGRADLVTANVGRRTLTVLHNSPVYAARFTGDGGGLAGLNASQITAGTIADARLSTNVALRGGGNVFTGTQIIANGSVGIGTAEPASALDVAGTVRATAFSGNGGGLTNVTAAALRPGATLTGITSLSRGADVASAVTITPSGNVFHVTGAGFIAAVASTGIAAGTSITMIFDSPVTVVDNNSTLNLAGNFSTTPGHTLTLIFDGTNWYELARSKN